MKCTEQELREIITSDYNNAMDRLFAVEDDSTDAAMILGYLDALEAVYAVVFGRKATLEDLILLQNRRRQEKSGNEG